MTCLTDTNPHEAPTEKPHVILAQGLFGCKGSDCPTPADPAKDSAFFKKAS